MHRRSVSFVAALLVLACLGCRRNDPRPGTVLDEAARAGVTPEMLSAATEDYFHDMDFNLVNGKRPVFTPQEIAGRNMWLVWTAGDDRLWDALTLSSLGTFDLLKTISSHSAVRYADPHAQPGDQP